VLPHEFPAAQTHEIAVNGCFRAREEMTPPGGLVQWLKNCYIVYETCRGDTRKELERDTKKAEALRDPDPQGDQQPHAG
jgi:hypothetical protein